MATLKPKQFIKLVFIEELGDLSNKNHYISFAIMATGIEFLGKCLDKSAGHWNVSGRSRTNFLEAINSLNSLSKYKPYDAILYSDLRCGFSHSFVPKSKLTLSSKDECPHMQENAGRLNLKCEEFYIDFKNACQEIIDMNFSDMNDKMNKELLFIPGDNFNETTNLQSAITESISR
jgi:hypothetical protein